MIITIELFHAINILSSDRVSRTFRSWAQEFILTEDLLPKFICMQAVLKSFSGYGTQEYLVLDEAELQRHQQLERLYISTKAAKVCLVHFSHCVCQRDLTEMASIHAILFFKTNFFAAICMQQITCDETVLLHVMLSMQL